jgi:hypothetical protein
VFCDLPHEAEAEAETVGLQLGREAVEVDLCTAHRAELIAPLAAVGRTVRKPGRKPAPKA